MALCSHIQWSTFVHCLAEPVLLGQGWSAHGMVEVEGLLCGQACGHAVAPSSIVVCWAQCGRINACSPFDCKAISRFERSAMVQQSCGRVQLCHRPQCDVTRGRTFGVSTFPVRTNRYAVRARFHDDCCSTQVMTLRGVRAQFQCQSCTR